MTFNSNPIFVDVTVFMGMHARCTEVRQRSLMVMSQNFGQRIYMSLEQVGLCDDIVWGYPRHIQDDYYPFMDCLHSEMDIQRVPYSRDDLLLAADILDHDEQTLSPCQALVLAQVINREGTLASHDPHLARAALTAGRLLQFPILTEAGHEKITQVGTNQLFNEELDWLYARSRCLVHE